MSFHKVELRSPELTVYAGNMYGGKTRNLIEKAKAFEKLNEIKKGNHKMGVFKLKLDTQYASDMIVSHSGKKIPARVVNSVAELRSIIEEEDLTIVFIDNVQLFLEKQEGKEFYEITYLMKDLLFQKRRVFVTGIEKDFRGLPFGPIGEILTMSTGIKRFYTMCNKCNQAYGVLPQRLINGEPAHENDPLVLIGAKESYEVRCYDCFEIRK